MNCLARPEVLKKIAGEYGHKHARQESSQSRRHISTESTAIQNNNFGSTLSDRSHYQSTVFFILFSISNIPI